MSVKRGRSGRETPTAMASNKITDARLRTPTQAARLARTDATHGRLWRWIRSPHSSSTPPVVAFGPLVWSSEACAESPSRSIRIPTGGLTRTKMHWLPTVRSGSRSATRHASESGPRRQKAAGSAARSKPFARRIRLGGSSTSRCQERDSATRWNSTRRSSRPLSLLAIGLRSPPLVLAPTTFCGAGQTSPSCGIRSKTSPTGSLGQP